MKNKKRVVVLLSAIAMMVGMIIAMAIVSSAATAVPEEGMAFEQDVVYEMYNIAQIDEDFTIESELWIDPTSSDGYRGGIIVSDYMNYADEFESGVVPFRRVALELYKNGRVRFWTDDAGVCEFEFDVRTAINGSEFINIAVTVNVLKPNNTGVAYTYENLNENKDADGSTIYTYKNQSGETVYGEVTLYIDGEAKQTMTITDETCAPGWFTLDSTLWVGGDHRLSSGIYNGEYFKGKMKNLTIYTDLRTDAEIAASAAAEVYSVDATDTNLCVAYDLTSETFAKDLSANANNLKFTSRYGTTFTDKTVRYYLEKPLAVAPRTYEAVIYAPTEGVASGRAGVIMSNYYQDPETKQEQKCIDFEIYHNGAPILYIVDNIGRVKAEFKNTDVRREGWVHLVIVDDGSYYHCYVDGVLSESLAHKDVCTTKLESFDYDIERVQSQKTISVGRDERTTQIFKGKIKNIAYYSEPLTAEQIKASYENGVNLSNDDLMFYYDLSVDSGKNIIRDESGNGYHASAGFYERDEEITDYAYSFAIVGDTQRQVWADWQKATDDIVGNETSYTANIYKWIVENKDEKNIQWVFGLGDITENNGIQNGSTMLEWDIAVDAIMQLEEAGMNYSVIMGNHDFRGSTTANFHNYFANPDDDFYTRRVTGYYEEGKLGNYYINFEVSGVKYMVLCLEYGPNDKILKWAADVVDAHPERRVIVTTHAYLYSDGTTVDKNDPTPPNTTGVVANDTTRNNGDMMWDKFISQHRNILIVLSGHETCEDVIMRQDRGVNGNLVSQFLVDPQGMSWDSGMVCMFYFSADGKDVKVEWISAGKTVVAQATNPDAEDILYKATNQFEFTVYDNYNNFVHSSGIALDESDETKTVYRIYYTNGTYSEFVINHGKDGADGADGKDGQNGTSVTVTEVKKTGTVGLVDTYTIYFSDGTTTTFTVTNGKGGVGGTNGNDGNDISSTIVSVEKTATDGLVDTYTITFADGTTATFTVTNGKDGADGKDGQNGTSVVVTEVKKTGTDGLVDTYTIYFSDGTATTFTVTNGKDGVDGVNGINGKDGISATVVSVEKTATDGLVDTYTITFADGTTATFTVTNGKDGADGKDGKDGKDGADGKDGTSSDKVNNGNTESKGFFAKIIEWFKNLFRNLFGLNKETDSAINNYYEM